MITIKKTTNFVYEKPHTSNEASILVTVHPLP